MFGTDKKIERLQQIPMLRGCSPSELRAIASIGDMIALNAGDIARRGTRDDSFVLILTGEATVDGRPIGRGDCHGALGLLTDTHEDGQVTMVTNGRVLILGPREFRSVLRRSPSFAVGVARDILRRRTTAA
jgi:CRP-like cAMP-binding protein